VPSAELRQNEYLVSQSVRAMTDAQLRVLSWNIHKGIGGVDRRYDLDRTIAVIRHYDPDIVLLQEVAQGMRRLRHQDQVELLTRALGLHAAFYPEHQFRVGGYGNLVLARWPIFSTAHLDLTIGGRKRRGMLQAHVRTHFDGHQRTIVVHNMHLGLAGSERQQQLNRFISSLPLQQLHHNTPTIVAGDLNDLWGTLGAKHLLPCGFKRAGTLANTFPSALPLRPLDGLFFRGNLKLLHSSVVRSSLSRAASDHLPLYADFTLTLA
jgi:endonuclease/exonuclease/phosphatase family metal-dependent hydrolase